jgi:serine/threonine protein kinase
MDPSLEEGVIAKLDLGCTHLLPSADSAPVPYWLAPELLSRASQPSTKSDIYSFALVLWELLAGAAPFGEFEDLAAYPDELQEAIVQGLRPTIPDRAPFDFARVIEDCWNKDATKRPTADDVVRRLQAFTLRYSMHSALFKDDDSSSSSRQSPRP